MKLQLILAKWLRRTKEGQEPDRNWYPQACEAFWAACMAAGQPQPKGPQHTVLQMQLSPLAGAGSHMLFLSKAHPKIASALGGV